MPRTRSLAWSELKIGILAVAALVLAVDDHPRRRRPGRLFLAALRAEDAVSRRAGLKSGAVVRVAGVEVGKVTEVEFAGAEVEVTARGERRSNEQRITDRVARVDRVAEPARRAGHRRSARRPGHAAQGRRLHPAGRRRAQIADVAEEATQDRSSRRRRILKDIRAGKGTVGKLFTDDQLYKELNAFVGVGEGVTRRISRARGTLGKLANDPDGLQRAQRVAREPAGDDAPHQRRRGQPRQAAEGRRARQVADGDHGQFRADHGAPEPRRRHGRASC